MSREARVRQKLDAEDAAERRVFYVVSTITAALFGLALFDVGGLSTVWWIATVIGAVVTDRLH